MHPSLKTGVGAGQASLTDFSSMATVALAHPLLPQLNPCPGSSVGQLLSGPYFLIWSMWTNYLNILICTVTQSHNVVLKKGHQTDI